MRTRTSRNGREQVLLGVWIDKAVYDELERVAKGKSITIAEVTRTLLERSVEAESHRPDAEQIVQSLLYLSEAERESLRQQFASGAKKTGAAGRKERAISALREQKAKELPPGAEPTPGKKPKFP